MSKGKKGIAGGNSIKKPRAPLRVRARVLGHMYVCMSDRREIRPGKRMVYPAPGLAYFKIIVWGTR